MKANVGIRRRLAPLLENDLGQIKLFNGLLLSLPGSPVMYYGDEIGMGDNIYLGDRDGVRTPMQWNADRNAGFSQADPQKLYLPLILDPVYGYQALNVDAQMRSGTLAAELDATDARRSASSTRCSAWAATTSSSRATRRVLAFVREFGDDRVLCVNNLSRFPQPVELDLRRFEGCNPVELTGRVPFPRDRRPALPARPCPGTASTGSPWAPSGGERMSTTVSSAVHEVLRTWLPDQRWYAGKGQSISAVTVEASVCAAPRRRDRGQPRPAAHRGRGRRRALPAAARPAHRRGRPSAWRTPSSARPATSPLYDAVHDEVATDALLRRLVAGEDLPDRPAVAGERRPRRRPTQPGDGRRAEQHLDRLRRGLHPQALPPPAARRQPRRGDHPGAGRRRQHAHRDPAGLARGQRSTAAHDPCDAAVLPARLQRGLGHGDGQRAGPVRRGRPARRRGRR